ncbi:MAG: hypothetical protein FH751_06825 [Firmicutes bacterium]|nr:hypothetical protein [Bacillota bacterium]
MKKNFPKFPKFYCKSKLKKVIGIVLAVIGTIIIIQVVPFKFWLLLLGILLVLLGWTFYRMF